MGNDPGITKFKTVDDIFDCIERGALVYVDKGESWQDKPVEKVLKIGIFLVLDTIHEKLMNESDRYWATLEETDYYKRCAKEDRNSFIKNYDRVIKMISDKLVSDVFKVYLMTMDTYLGGTGEHRDYRHYKDLLFMNSGISLDMFLAEMEKATNFEMMFGNLRKLWLPQTGSGSQSQELETYKVLAESMLDYIKNWQSEQQKADEEMERMLTKQKNRKKK